MTSPARAIYSIDAEVLRRFNTLYPQRMRSKVVEELLRRKLDERERELEAIAREVETHPDFEQARADAEAWDATTADGVGRR